MNILDITIKSFIKLILICLGIISALFLVYHFTAGGFFDVFLLTLIGLTFTYLILILIVLFFKLITNFFMKRKEGLLVMVITFALTVITGVYLFKAVFRTLLEFQD